MFQFVFTQLISKKQTSKQQKTEKRSETNPCGNKQKQQKQDCVVNTKDRSWLSNTNFHFHFPTQMQTDPIQIQPNKLPGVSSRFNVVGGFRQRMQQPHMVQFIITFLHRIVVSILQSVKQKQQQTR